MSVGIIRRTSVPSRTSWYSKWNPPADCVLWLPGQDDAQSGTIRDRSGYENHGTLAGADWVWTRLPSGFWAMYYGGVTGYTTATANTVYDSLGESGFEAWVNLIDVGASVNGIFGRKNDNFKLSVLGSTWGNTIFVSIGVLVSDDINTGVSYATHWGNWRHIVYYISESTNTFKVFLNGVNVYTTGAWTGSLEAAVGQPMFVAGAQSYKPKGYITLQRIYNTLPSDLMPLDHFNQERHLFGV